MTDIVNRKIGVNRGNKRIWLEGRILEKNGIKPDDRIEIVECSPQFLQFNVGNEGSKKVSSRKVSDSYRKPIIDINNSDITKAFEGVDKITVEIDGTSIRIRAHGNVGLILNQAQQLYKKFTSGKPLNVASLYHGGGILDRAVHDGFAKAGIKTRLELVVEMEQQYLDSSLLNNHEIYDSHTKLALSDIKDLDFSYLNKKVGSIDILIAGIPCEANSKAGRTKNKLWGDEEGKHAEEHSKSGNLFYYTLNAIQALQPKVILLENVTEYQSSAAMAVIRSVLDHLGYDVQERVLYGNEFGCLENRARLCVVANIDLPKYQLNDAVALKSDVGTVSDILMDIDVESDRYKTYDYLDAKQKRDKENGKNFARQILRGPETKVVCNGKGYAKARSTEAFVQHPTNPALSRLFHPTEHARVKGIPEYLVAGNFDTHAHQILGQSVIFPAFESIAYHLGLSLWARYGYQLEFVLAMEDQQPAWKQALYNEHSGELKGSPFAKERLNPIINNGHLSLSNSTAAEIFNSVEVEEMNATIVPVEKVGRKFKISNRLAA